MIDGGTGAGEARRSAELPAGFEFVGHAGEFFAFLAAEGPAADFAELSAEGLLIVVGHDVVAHVEEHVVFLVDVVVEEVEVSAGGGAESLFAVGVAALDRLEGVAHVLRVGSSLAVFFEHDADRTSVARDSAGLENREEQVFLLGVVTGVCEEAEELDALLERIGLEAFAAIGPDDEVL